MCLSIWCHGYMNVLYSCGPSAFVWSSHTCRWKYAAPNRIHPMISEVCVNASVQNEDVCVKTATFCRFMIPGLFPWSLVTILMKVCVFIFIASHSIWKRACIPLLDLPWRGLKVVTCVIFLHNSILSMLHPIAGSCWLSDAVLSPSHFIELILQVKKRVLRCSSCKCKAKCGLQHCVQVSLSHSNTDIMPAVIINCCSTPVVLCTHVHCILLRFTMPVAPLCFIAQGPSFCSTILRLCIVNYTAL